jgi:predicted permease
MGYVFGLLSRASSNETKLMMICIGFGDVTDIPLTLCSVLATSSIFDSEKTFTQDATTYTLIYNVFITALKWSVAYVYLIFRIMKPDGSSKVNSKLNDSDFVFGESQDSAEEGFWWTVNKIMNPPIYAAIIGIPLAFVPCVKEYVFVQSGAAFKNNLFLGMVKLGSVVTPLINVLVGSKLAKGYPPGADISWFKLGLIWAGKLVIMPFIALGICLTFYHYDVTNKILTLMMLIIFASPTSLQLLMICTKHQNQVDNITKVYVLMYTTSMITIFLWVFSFLLILY